MVSNSKFEQRANNKIRTFLGFGQKEFLVDLEFAYRDASLSYPKSALLTSNTSEIRWKVEEEPISQLRS